MAKKSIIRRGISAALETSKGGRFLSLVSEQPVDVAMLGELDDILTVDTHSWWDYNPAPHLVCLGPDCPSCALSNEARPTSYLPVCTPDGEVKFMIVKTSILTQLQRYAAAVGALTGRVIRLEKTGTGLKTKYAVMPLGKKVNVAKFVVPELEDFLGPLTLAEQIEKMSEAGIDITSVKKLVATRAKAVDEVEATETETESAAGWTETEESSDDDSWGVV